MRKLTLTILALIALVVGAQAAQVYIGGDSTGTGYAAWFANLEGYDGNVSDNDTLNWIGNSSDSGANPTFTEDGLVWYLNGYTASITGGYLRFGYFGPIDGGNVIVHGGSGTLDLCLNFSYGGSGVFNDLTVNFPSGGNTYKANSTISVSCFGEPDGTALTFDNCTLSSDTTFALFSVYDNGDHDITLNNCTSELMFDGLATYGRKVNITIDSLTYDETMGWDLAFDINKFTMTNSTFACDSNCAVEWQMADSVIVRGNSFLGWGQNDTNQNSALYVNMPAQSDSLDTRYYDISDNDFSPRALARDTRILGAIVVKDTLDASVYSLKNNRIGVAGAAADSILYAVRIMHQDPSVYLDSSTVHTGIVQFVMADTTNAPGTHTFDYLTIDHTNWGDPGGSAALTVLTKNQTITGLSVTTSLAHAVFFSSDDMTGKVPGITNANRYGSYNTVVGSTFNHLAPSVDVMYGIVIKAVDVDFRNCAFTRVGDPVARSGLILFAGDSCLVTNSTFTTTSTTAVADSAGVIGQGTTDGHGPAENVVQNCVFSGTSHYVFCTLFSTGSGGVSENNNSFVDLTYTTFDEDAAVTMSSTSGTTAAWWSWAGSWGGAAATGITGTADSGTPLYPIGIQTSTFNAPKIDPAQTAFRYPVEALETLRGIAAGKGYELEMRVPDYAEYANLQNWLEGLHPNGSGTYDNQAADTLRITRCYR